VADRGRWAKHETPHQMCAALPRRIPSVVGIYLADAAVAEAPGAYPEYRRSCSDREAVRFIYRDRAVSSASRMAMGMGRPRSAWHGRNIFLDATGELHHIEEEYLDFLVKAERPTSRYSATRAIVRFADRHCPPRG
jgi:hypothetical protein